MRLWSSLVARVTAFTIVVGIVLALVAVFGIDLTARMYHQEANQRLHQDLAQWLVKQYRFERDGHLDETGIAMVFGDAMRVNPSIEVYLIDTAGKILAFNAPRGHVKLTQVDMEPIFRFLSATAAFPIIGSDPRNPGSRQVFSAAPVRVSGETIGYAYVVVGGELYQDWVSRLRVSRILRTAVVGAGTVILVGALSGFAGFWFFTRRITALASDMQSFSTSGFTQLPSPRAASHVAHSVDEIDRLRASFAELAGVVHGQVAKLQAADTQLREAITSLSHDLMTPLTALGGYLETIKLGGDALSLHELQDYVDLAIAQHRRLSRLVRSQFDLAMLESAAFQFDPQYSSLSDLVHDIGQKFMPTAKAAGVNLTVDSLPTEVYADADVGLLERVLENLISNAIRHTPTGGQVTIRIREDAETIAIDVEDTGCGIAAEDLPHIFDRYFRGSNASRARSDGAGLGLAIAKRIIELHGGEITVFSNLGSGSAFRFYLHRIHVKGK